MRRIGFFVVLAALLGGCTTAQGPNDSPAGFSSTTDAAVAVDAVSTGIASDYRIGPLDLLEVSVFQVPDLNKTVQVSSSGTIVLPLVGTIAARGKTADQLQADIGAKLGAKYLQNPQVSVFVKEAQSQRVTIEGAVNKPGIYMTSGRTTLLQGIALAGGLSEIAEKGVVVFRQVGSKRQAAKFDFKAIHAGTTDDPVLQGGDIVAVDQSGMKATLRDLRATVPVFGVFSPLL